MKKNNLVERIYLSFDDFGKSEKGMLQQEHLRRYGSIRRFCYGKVLDFACGCGYGTFLIAGNPDVIGVVGVDRDKEAIDWAKNLSRNLHFPCAGSLFFPNVRRRRNGSS